MDKEKIVKRFEKELTFSEEDKEKRYSYEDVCRAGFIAFDMSDNDCHKSEFYNLLLSELKNKK